MASSHQSPTGHRFGRPRRLAEDPPASAHDSQSDTFIALPPPPGPAPYHLALADVIGQEAADAVTKAGWLDLHTMGDTGGVKNPVPQENVAAAIEEDLGGTGPAFDPAFLYVLGDCIYFNGEESQYYAQFYEPYTHYTRPIVAVPGNHDGLPLTKGQTTLDGFLQNFCTTTPTTNTQSMGSGRTTMTQPNVFWTLAAPFATIVGLYTNVSETEGKLDDTQLAWLENELRTAPADEAVILTMHHPAISADSSLGPSNVMFETIDKAAAAAGRWPDLVLAGHVHDYQRFTRTVTKGHEVPYVVVGSGGYHNLTKLAADATKAKLPWPMPKLTGVTLDAWDDTHYGYCRLRVTRTEITMEYLSVSPSPGVAADAIKPTVEDSFTLDLAAHTVSKGGSIGG